MDRCTKISVVIETARHMITGNVTLPEGQRLSDYVNAPERTFFAVTEASMAALDNIDHKRPVEFVLVNRSEVEVISPGIGVEASTEPVYDDTFRAALGL